MLLIPKSFTHYLANLTCRAKPRNTPTLAAHRNTLAQGTSVHWHSESYTAEDLSAPEPRAFLDSTEHDWPLCPGADYVPFISYNCNISKFKILNSASYANFKLKFRSCFMYLLGIWMHEWLERAAYPHYRALYTSRRNSISQYI